MFWTVKIEPIYQGTRIGHLRTSIPYATKGGVLNVFLGFQQLRTSLSLITFSCATKSRYALNFSIFEVSMTIFNNINGGPKTNRRVLTLWTNSMLLGVIIISYPRFRVVINIIFKKENSYCVTICSIPQCTCQTSPNYPLKLYSKNGDGCTANIFVTYLDFSMRWITTMVTLFVLQHIHATRSCDYMSLSVM